MRISPEPEVLLQKFEKRFYYLRFTPNFPFLSSNIPSSPAYGVFISQLIRYAKACSSYECFILRAARLSSKLLGQRYVMERLKSFLRKFYGRYRDLIKHYEVSVSQMLHDILGHDMYNDTLNWSDITPICELYTELDCITDFDLITKFWGFHRTLQRVRLDNRGCLLLRTPGPASFGTCICSYVETNLSWTCHVYGPFEFRTSLGTSILLLDNKMYFVVWGTNCVLWFKSVWMSCKHTGTVWNLELAPDSHLAIHTMFIYKIMHVVSHIFRRDIYCKWRCFIYTMFTTPLNAYFYRYSFKNFTNQSLNSVHSENRKINILIKITLRDLFAWHGSFVYYTMAWLVGLVVRKFKVSAGKMVKYATFHNTVSFCTMTFVRL